jgi:uncharacterized Zn-binding protein involved in type VI secretion
MGLPAARVTDTTGHGTPLAPGPGCPTVLINKKPAWRVGTDKHACPLVTVLVPHLVGVVARGSMRVTIAGLFAARQGDMVIEAGGGPNPIAAGEPTVLIG